MQELQQVNHNCLICGDELVYFTTPFHINCEYCGKEFKATVKCKSNHYVCDECHALPSLHMIREVCIQSTTTNPIELAQFIMKHPNINMHGPEHHFLVPAVLLSAYFNKLEQYSEKEKAIKEAQRRTKYVLGGFCGSHGSCGAAIGTGVFISIITNATPLSSKNWGFSNLMTSIALLEISKNGGPRCCKRCSFVAILQACRFIEEKFDIHLAYDENVDCLFYTNNKQCRKASCLFFPEKL